MYETLVSVQPWNWIYMNIIEWFNIVYHTVCSVQVKYNTHHVSKAEPNSGEMHTNSTWLLPFSSTENFVRVQVSHIIYCWVIGFKLTIQFHIQNLVSSPKYRNVCTEWGKKRDQIKRMNKTLIDSTNSLTLTICTYLCCMLCWKPEIFIHGPVVHSQPPANELILCKW